MKFEFKTTKVSWCSSYLAYFSSPFSLIFPVGLRKSPMKTLVLKLKCSRWRFLTPFFSRYYKEYREMALKKGYHKGAKRGAKKGPKRSQKYWELGLPKDEKELRSLGKEL